MRIHMHKSIYRLTVELYMQVMIRKTVPGGNFRKFKEKPIVIAKAPKKNGCIA
ncbi:unnamed protein product [Sphenostylis stenocarpa]|uniref:Uncharacterized protein n=1 Tax=Sphenostylis stenocarpa TaxID=92480 RepID=A0AA87B7J7_9FABA|nr:unnamed protein product [Sphenostylis stenocarpa]